MSFVFAPEDVTPTPQYIEEQTYGTTPASPNMKWIGFIQNVTPTINPSNLGLRGLTRDLSYIRRGLRAVDISIKYVPQLESLTGFLRYGLDWITKSMSIEYAVERNETVVSLNHKGCKVANILLEAKAQDWVFVTQDCIGQDLAVATSKIGNSYQNEPISSPYSTFDMKVYKGALQLEKFSNLSFNIVNGLIRKPVIRSSNSHLLKYLVEGRRDINGEITAYFENKTEFDDIINDTAFDLKIYLGTKYFTFAGAKWNLSQVPTEIDVVPCTIRLPWTSKSVTLT